MVASQLFAATPAIRDTAGQPVPNSIAVLEKVTLNGSEQWITIRGQDRSNPVLLNLGMGGPGGGGFATRTLFTPLEAHFTVVSWDEPGTGKSINAVPFAELTPQRFIDDGTRWRNCCGSASARTRSTSTGCRGRASSACGWCRTARSCTTPSSATVRWSTRPRTTGRATSWRSTTPRSAATRPPSTLRANGPPPYTGQDLVFRYVAFLDVLNDYMGAARYAVVVPIVPFFAPEYGWVDKVNHTRGLIDSFNVVYPQLADLDFRTQAPGSRCRSTSSSVATM